MQRSATLTGPGIPRSPAIQYRTVRASTSNRRAASAGDQPSAAMAAANSAGCTDDARVIAGHAGALNSGADCGQVIVNAERVGQPTISHEHGQTFGPILAAGHEADGIGGQGGAGDWLAHEPTIGTMFRTVKHEMPGASRLHQGLRPESADNQARPDVSSQQTSPAASNGGGVFWEGRR